MSKESSQFATMLRTPRNQIPTETRCWLWCPVCGERKAHSLAHETELDEVYACPDCGNQQSYRVR